MTSRNSGRHHRHLVELASLLATAGLADAFADVFGLRRHGATVLIVLGIALVVGTVGHHIWLRRTDHAPPAKTRAPLASAMPTSDVLAASIEGASADSVPTDETSVGVFWRLRTEVDNTPGRLAVLAGALAAAGANIQALGVHPAPAGVIDEFLIEASEDTSAERICAAVNAVGGRNTHAVPADVFALLDAPTYALELAGRLVRNHDALDAVLTDLLDADSVTVGAADPGAPGARIDGTTLMLQSSDGTTCTAVRPYMPFTATELSRARALLELMATCSARSTEATSTSST
ncbi:hypothetical protein [Actinospica sp.]|jgi:hypothetical protein|uniref:hypothetical protein n=1 Tax=Actinospica sp. TaxID=1872142 RepID=UPI002C9788B8|nr:hypothetical protein [Actinospica sp.]HWG26659.1 hypothetical protein [Actinospica sp.]